MQIRFTLKSRLFNSEVKIVWLGIIFDVLVSALVAPKDAFFFPNFLYFFGSQVAVLVLLLLFRPRPAVVSGAAAAVPTYLCVFLLYLWFHPDREGLAILGYFFSLPGAVIGGGVAKFCLRRRLLNREIVAVLVSTGFVFAGLLINQAVVCNTMMYCPGLTFLKLN